MKKVAWYVRFDGGMDFWDKSIPFNSREEAEKACGELKKVYSQIFPTYPGGEYSFIYVDSEEIDD